MKEKSDLVEVPFEQLDAETLRAVIEAFILREGTNYGAPEVFLETQIGQVHTQLRNKTVLLVFDPDSESCSLITARQFRDRRLKRN